MIFRSPYPEIDIPEVPLTPFVLHRAAELGDKPALIEASTGRTITYGQLKEAIDHVAASLAQRGFRQGDVLGILSPNVPEYCIAFHAVASLGGVVTPINPLYIAHEISLQLKDAGARLLITIPALIDKAREAAEASRVEEIFVFGDIEGATPFSSLLQGNGPPRDCPRE